MSRIAGLTLALILVATGAWAQEWRGNGRIMGKVIDEQGKPLEGVVVRASLPSFMGVLVEAKSNKKGEFAVDDVGEGDWQLTFDLKGFVQGKNTCEVDGNGRSDALKITLKKVFDPNAFIQEEGKKANALMEQKKYAEARAIAQNIAAKVPQVDLQMQLFIAQTYLFEGNAAKAAETAKAVLAKDPANAQVKALLVNALLESGSIDEAGQVMKGIEEAKLTDATIYANFGVALVNKQRNSEALAYFDKATAKFPQSAEPYYYRAKAMAGLVNDDKDPKSAARIERLGKMKEDLSKFLALAPTSPAAVDAKSLLEQVEKMLASSK